MTATTTKFKIETVEKTITVEDGELALLWQQWQATAKGSGHERAAWDRIVEKASQLAEVEDSVIDYVVGVDPVEGVCVDPTPAERTTAATADDVWAAIKAFRKAAEGDSDDEEHDAAVTLADEAASFLQQHATTPELSNVMPDVVTVGKVPPDPEDKNDERAEWAIAAVKTFGVVTGECFDQFEGEERTDILKQNISDFLADLAHLCDREEIDLRERLSAAQGHYNEETDNKGEQWMDPAESKQ